MTLPPSLTVLIPCFNEAEAMGGTLDGVLEVADRHGWPVVVVDDGSTDGTAEVLAGYAGRVQVIRHTFNRGYGASLKTGLLSARTRDVMFFDADGQHDPSDIERLAAELDAHEFVMGARPRLGGVPWIRKPGKVFLHALCNFLAARAIPDINCGFRAGRRVLFLRMLDLLPNGFSFSTTSLMHAVMSRYAVTFVPVQIHFRKGTSTVNILYDGTKTAILALRLIMLFNPLRAFLGPAAVLFLAGVIYQMTEFYLHGLHIRPGAILSILSSIILFHFGLVADQIACLRKEISSLHSVQWDHTIDDRDPRGP